VLQSERKKRLEAEGVGKYQMSKFKVLEFPEFLENTVVPERKFVFQTAALQHRMTAAHKLGRKG